MSYVACMARRYAARVTLLHAMELPIGAYPAWPVYGAAIDLPGMEDDRKQRLESFQPTLFEPGATTRLVLEGDPAWRIADYSEKENVDLIMMPTHGYGPFRQLLLGSVTAKVLHDVKCPVGRAPMCAKLLRPPAAIETCFVRWTSLK
jgi:nucleotide-binding universal stress UspA family protein